MDTISAREVSYRISANADGNNRASSFTRMIQGSREVSVEDSPANGTSAAVSTLKKSSVYESLEWDFYNQWTISIGESFPFSIKQSVPGKVSQFVSGSRGKISGTADGVGTVYVFIGDNMYESFIVDGQWEVTLPHTSVGAEAFVSVAIDGLMPSYLIKAIAEEVSVTPTYLSGDANGDGAVDSADVTAIINYILGKPSASFNMENADVTGDGEILIDDAVQTVQMIMDAQ